MNLELGISENRMQKEVCYISWWWQVAHVIPGLVVNNFFKGASVHPTHL